MNFRDSGFDVSWQIRSAGAWTGHRTSNRLLALNTAVLATIAHWADAFAQIARAGDDFRVKTFTTVRQEGGSMRFCAKYLAMQTVPSSTCADHAPGGACETATTDCSGDRSTNPLAVVAKCRDPGAGPTGTRAFGEWSLATSAGFSPAWT